MSNKLLPVDFGLSDVRIKETDVAKICRLCKDPFHHYRWSDIVCPDCDIKRLVRISASLKEIEASFQETPTPNPQAEEAE